MSAYFARVAGEEFISEREEMMELLQKEVRLQQVVKLVGPDALPDSQRFIIEICSLFKNGFLQQNAFDDIDKFSTIEKQKSMLSLILQYYRRGSEAIKKGIPLSKIRRMPVVSDLVKMKLTIANGDTDSFDKLALSLEKSISKLEALYAE